MTSQIDILLPGETKTYQVGIDNVTQINVHFYFANVVFIKIYFSSGTVMSYYQCPCVVHDTP